MPFLIFTNPTDIGAYSGWDFEVLPARITLRLEDMRDIYSSYVESWRDYVSRMSKESGRHKEYVRVSELARVLTHALEQGSDIELDGHDYVWSFCSELMFDLHFVTIVCPSCNRQYGSAECSVEKWAYGSGLAAEGGRRVICPSGHTLYSCGEWCS
ncbi:MAG: hypothetical protein Q8M07_25400 [Prosthecobacter sp.]|nr:hypothetical protein [Prosthecobacter sp.]HBJ85755.1 hypothetical protein [Verrucomicrobiales bacterium]